MSLLYVAIVVSRNRTLACSAFSRAGIFLRRPTSFSPRLNVSHHFPDACFLSLTLRRGLARQAGTVRLHRSFLLLGVSQHAEPHEVREAYIKLAKVYHPDSGSPHASNDKFIQIREAYMLCMSHAKNTSLSEQMYRALEQELYALDKSLGYQRRRLPHRHYLTYDAGPGTPSQRQREHAQSRLNQATDSVYERQLQKALQNSEVTDIEPYSSSRRKRSMRLGSAPLERIADERILEAMGSGGFAKIKGKGAPIRNDPATHMLDNLDEKLNKVLISAGCAPDWVMLGREIHEDVERLRKEVEEAWLRCGPDKVSTSAETEWHEQMELFKINVEKINTKIRKLNFEVPSLHMQRTLLRCEAFVQKVIKDAGMKPSGQTRTENGLPVNECQPPTEQRCESVESDPITRAVSRFMSLVWRFIRRNVN